MDPKEILAVLSTVCALIFGYIAFFRNRKKDDTDAGRASGTLLSDIGYIKSGVDDIKTEQKEQRKTNMEVVSRLTAVEESAKQAHKRIDELKKP
jgi:hypothetical protein